MTQAPETFKRQKLNIPQGALIGPNQQPIYGWKEVNAYILGGLALHKSLGIRPASAWTVTHQKSGHRIDLLSAKTMRQGQANLKAALNLPVDWTLNDRDILQALRKNPRIQEGLREIAAVTAEREAGRP